MDGCPAMQVGRFAPSLLERQGTVRSCCPYAPGGTNRKDRTGKQAHIRFVQQALFCPKVAGVTEALTADNDDTTQFAAEPSWDILSSWKGITRLSWPKTSSTQKPACQPQYLLIRGLSQERGDSLSYGTKLPRSETSLPRAQGLTHNKESAALGPTLPEFSIRQIAGEVKYFMFG